MKHFSGVLRYCFVHILIQYFVLCIFRGVIFMIDSQTFQKEIKDVAE